MTDPKKPADVGLPIVSAAGNAGPTIHSRLGDETFWRIARAFYARVEVHPRLRPIFPKDLDEPIRNQAEFLIQYFGGPHAYSDRKGHPRLRMRHAPFPIDMAMRNDWVECMRGALTDAGIPEPIFAEMMAYFERTATFMINKP
ncbi:MAG: globin [Planctomycetes bacterium]|nr:globin [Planctomycetota bacterium]